jgi:transcriptional regulator with XRE-family HTH domain
MKNAVGPRIRAARYRSGRKITQEELAARLQAVGLDIGQTAIAKIEARRRPVTDLELLAICKALKVKLSFLFGQE